MRFEFHGILIFVKYREKEHDQICRVLCVLCSNVILKGSECDHHWDDQIDPLFGVRRSLGELFNY